MGITETGLASSLGAQSPFESPHPRQPLTSQAAAELVVVSEVEAGEEREAGLVHEAGAAAEGAAQREAALATAQQVRRPKAMWARPLN